MPQEIFHITSAGSVDDGKSTILARLLLDTGSVFEDQLAGVNPREVDATTLADLLDGLESERAQGITIDVAHRFFDSETRRYHIADSPGHEQYTRNMATAASHADALLLVVDARIGIKPQTIKHVAIARKLGIDKVIVAINKMDLVDYKKGVFQTIHRDLTASPYLAGLASLQIIPVSGLLGDMVVRRTRKMTWFEGPTLLEALDALSLTRKQSSDAIFSIQLVQRLPGGGRRYLGSLLQGGLSQGMELRSPRYGNRRFVVDELIESGHYVENATGPAEIALAISSEVDLERGDVLTNSSDLAYTDQFEADLVWLDDTKGVAGRTVIIRLGHASVKASITRIFGVGENNQKLGQQDHIDSNDVVRVNLETHEKLAMAPLHQIPALGRLILVNPDTGNTLAAGVVNHTLRRGDNIVEHDFSVTPMLRGQLTGVQGRVVWFTGLSGSGKSTLANAVSLELEARKIPHSNLDGDALRRGLNKDLGFSEADRVENIRRTAEVAKLMADSGLVVLVSLISPYRADREASRAIIGHERFVEVFLDTPLEICEQRDPKGLYGKARRGLIPNFTGIGAPYEIPESPSLVVKPSQKLHVAAAEVVSLAVRSSALGE
jgi:bifunctional enzyme CysN/CysC